MNQDIKNSAPLAFNVTDLQQSRISAKIVNGTTISTEYNLLRGARPKTYEAHMAAWEGPEIPPSGPAWQSEPFPGNATSGSLTFTRQGVQDKWYTVSYLTHENRCTAAATATVKWQEEGDVLLASINIDNLTGDQLTLGYEVPSNIMPAKCGAWVGLWKGSSFRWDGTGRLSKTSVSQNSNEGSVTFDYRFQIDTEYTVVYATGPHDSDIATALTFRT